MLVNNYIGIPFKELGRDREGLDCWGLVRIFYKEQFNIDLPSFVEYYSTVSDREKLAELISQYSEAWTPTTEPKAGDVVLFRILGLETHVGIVVNDKEFLHVREGYSSTVERFASTEWKNRIVGYYRYDPENKNLARLTAAPHPLKTQKYTLAVKPGTTLQELVDNIQREYNISEEYKQHITIILNGRIINKDNWQAIQLQPHDVIEYRAIPTGTAGRLIAIFAVAFLAPYVAASLVQGTLVTTAAGVAAAASASPFLFAATSFAVSLVGNLLVNALFPVRPPAEPRDPGSSERQLMVTGGQNQANPYGAIPIVLGKVKMTPPLGATNFITFAENSDSYLASMLVWGYGPLTITDLKIGDVAAETYAYAKFPDLTNQLITLDRKSDTTEVLEKFDTIYGNDVAQEQVNTVLAFDAAPTTTRTDNEGWVTRSITNNNYTSINVAIHFPQGLRKIRTRGQGAGDSTAISLGIQIQYSTNAGSTWQNLTGDNTIVISEFNKDAFTKTFTKSFIIPQATTVSVRARRVTGDQTEAIADERYSHECVFLLATVISNTKPAVDPVLCKIAKTALKVKATDQLNGQIQGINALVQTYCLAYNGSTWALGNTNNPADLFRYVLQHPANPQRVTEADVAEKIDLAQIEYWWRYCNTNRTSTFNGTTETYKLTYNAVVAEARSVLEILRDICAAGRASPAMVDGKWTVVIDEPRAYPVQHFTTHNSWDFESTRVLQKFPDALKIRYFDEDQDYQEVETIVYNQGKTELNSELFETIDLPGVTKKAAVIDHARWHMAQAHLRKEVYTLNTDFEYLVCTRGDRVAVTHDVPLWGIASARIKNKVSSTLLELDEDFELADLTADYKIKVRTNNHRVAVTNIQRSSNIVTLTIANAGLFAPGDSIVVATSNVAINGSFEVLSVTNTSTTQQITYAQTGTNITSTVVSNSYVYIPTVTKTIQKSLAVIYGSRIENTATIYFDRPHPFNAGDLIDVNIQTYEAVVNSPSATTEFNKTSAEVLSTSLTSLTYTTTNTGTLTGGKTVGTVSLKAGTYNKILVNSQVQPLRTITTISRTSTGTVTVNFSAAHGFRIGQIVEVYSSDYRINGTVTITSIPSSLSIRYQSNTTGTINSITTTGKVELVDEQLEFNNLILFGIENNQSRITNDLLVLNIEPMQNKSARLTLIDYAEPIYTNYLNYTENLTFNTNITLKPQLNRQVFADDQKPLINTLTITSSIVAADVINQNLLTYNIRVPFGNPAVLPDSTESVECQYVPIGKTDNASYYRSITTNYLSNTVYIHNVKEGEQFSIRLRYINSLGIVGPWTLWVDHTVIGKNTLPSNVSNFTYTLKQGGIEFKWDSSTDLDYKSTVIKYTTTNQSWANASVLFDGNTSTWTWVTPPTGNYTVMIKHKDTADNESTNSTNQAINYTELVLASITAELSNPVPVVLYTPNTTTPILTGTGTQISVYQGGSLLKYDGVGTANGRWKIQSKVNSTGITSGNISSVVDAVNGDNSATIGNLSQFTAQNTATVTYTITGKTTLGDVFTLTRIHTYYAVKPADSATIVYAYKRSSAATVTDNPGAITYTFSTASITSPASLLNGWLKTIPSGTNPLWITTAAAFSNTGTDTIAANEWSSPIKFVENGTNGTDGTNLAIVRLYARNSSTNISPTLSTQGSATYTFATGAISGQPTGWSTTIPDSSFGTVIWTVQATASALGSVATDTIANTEWSSPVKLTEKGDTGGTGPRTAIGYVYFTVAQSTTPSTPTGSGYDFSNNTFTSLTANWQLSPVVAAVAANNANQKYWASRYIITEATFSGTQTVTFNTPSIHLNFDGIVTFTNLANATDKTNTQSSTIIDGSAIKTNTITANKIDTRNLDIKDASGNTIFSAGTNLASSRVNPAAGWLNSNIQINANGTLTGAGSGQVSVRGLGYTGNLAATSGSALNSDPKLTNASNWQDVVGYAIATFTTTTTGQVGNTVARSSGAGIASWMNEVEKIVIDPSHRYRVSGWLRLVSGSGKTAFFGVAIFDINNTTITGDGSQWLYAASDISPTTTWTYYSAEFGAGTKRPFPSAARTMSPLFILSYGTSGNSIHEIQDLVIEDITTSHNARLQSGRLVDASSWSPGQNPPWTLLGFNTNKSRIIRGVDHKNEVAALWECISNGSSDDQGGWNPGGEGNWFPVDVTKTYKFMCFVKRTQGPATGAFTYFGVTDGGSTSPVICNLNTTTVQTNGYFAVIAQNQLALPSIEEPNGRWYIMQGYIFPYGSIGNTNDNSGIYDARTGIRIATGTNFNWAQNVQYTGTRAYQYYSTSNQDRIVFAPPIVDIIGNSKAGLEELRITPGNAGVFIADAAIDARYIQADYLSSIVADLGTVTAGTFTGGTINGGTISASTINGGSINGTTGTFAGTLAAGVLDLEKLVGQSTEYTSPGTYTLTVPSNLGVSTGLEMKITLIGSGGGGGSGAYIAYVPPGAGGGSGAIVTITYSQLNAGQQYTLAIGTGGSGGSSGGNGGNGTATVLSQSGVIVAQAGGGFGGQGGASSSNPELYPPVGGAGGTGSGGTVIPGTKANDVAAYSPPADYGGSDD